MSAGNHWTSAEGMERERDATEESETRAHARAGGGSPSPPAGSVSPPSSVRGGRSVPLPYAGVVSSPMLIAMREQEEHASKVPPKLTPRFMH